MRMLKKDVPAEYNALIQKFRLIDDTFFNVCFDNYIEGMQLLLRIFFGRDDLVVKHVVTQQSADNLYGRGVRFDVLAEDSEGKLYDYEVQRANKGAAPRRARYNSSMMDARELAKSGGKYHVRTDGEIRRAKNGRGAYGRTPRGACRGAS